MVSVATWVVTVVDHAATIAAGEWITASGEWVNDRTHDLLSGLIRGIGPAYAKSWEDLRCCRYPSAALRSHRSCFDEALVPRKGFAGQRR
jgi:hypothetical protein